ncbi:MAG: hypothetical protein BWZ04_02633 [Firmicutes bacterium ADurb.BinA205]|nr:MAG: hypothetical protein BWZ04_02633 [Firmicutes bacterium ADurb.BinA205]
MKKIIPVLAAALISCSAVSVCASAEDAVNVTVTISDGSSSPVLIQQKVNVKDIDNDGKLTVNDALYIAHEENFSGGAAASYASKTGQYGLSLTKLWGKENNEAFGYYVNNVASMGLADPVSEGNSIYAFIYTDVTGYSDAYSWFDKNTADSKQGDEIELTLSRAAFDAAWNPVTLPVEGASITINGNSTNYKTDANGKVTVKLDDAGRNLISAKSDTLTLVPPVCVVNAEAVTAVTTAQAETTTTTEAATTTSSDTTTAESTTAASSTSAAATTTAKAGTSSKNDSPKTGDMGAGTAVVILGTAVCTAFALRKKNED